MEFRTSTSEATEKIGVALAEHLQKHNISRAFIAMRGEMGVGKTVFTRGFASVFGISGVKSPTYTIVNEHKSKSGVRIFHFDLYRITDSDDLYSIGYDDYVESEGYCIAEWSERVPYDIPSDAIFVTLSRTENDENGRLITIEGCPFAEDFSVC